MGERMIIMPQEINPEITLPDVMAMMVEVSSHHNVVIIVPSEKVTHGWTNVADQILIGDNVSAGVARLKAEHVGLTVLVNRYDGIDLLKEACRLLAIIDLPEAASLIDRLESTVLAIPSWACAARSSGSNRGWAGASGQLMITTRSFYSARNSPNASSPGRAVRC
jgi:hypothetical protein